MISLSLYFSGVAFPFFFIYRDEKKDNGRGCDIDTHVYPSTPFDPVVIFFLSYLFPFHVNRITSIKTRLLSRHLTVLA
jgi:hypothetical protein